MGGFLGIGTPKATSKAESNLNNVFNYAMPTGQGLTSAGASGVGDAMSRWKSLLSGNRSAIMGQIAPGVNAIQTQTDASRRNADASGTARGGGTAPINATAKDESLGKIQNAIFGAQSDAADKSAAGGGELLSAGSNVLGLGASATQAGGQLGVQKMQAGNQAFEGLLSMFI